MSVEHALPATFRGRSSTILPFTTDHQGFQRPASSQDSEILPSHYGVDLIVLQPRDPWWLHAYWELKASSIVAGREKLGAEGASAQFVLRVYQQEPHRWFDIHLPPEAADWTIEVEPDRAWTVEIGLKTLKGVFLPLARSNTVRTPPDRPSHRVDEKWGFLKSLPGMSWHESSSFTRPSR